MNNNEHIRHHSVCVKCENKYINVITNWVIRKIVVWCKNRKLFYLLWVGLLIRTHNYDTKYLDRVGISVRDFFDGSLIFKTSGTWGMRSRCLQQNFRSRCNTQFSPKMFTLINERRHTPWIEHSSRDKRRVIAQ